MAMKGLVECAGHEGERRRRNDCVEGGQCLEVGELVTAVMTDEGVLPEGFHRQTGSATLLKSFVQSQMIEV